MKLGTLCYIKKDDKTLMLHRIIKKNDIHEGKYNGLGGKMEAGESPEECIIREVEEESGLLISNPHLCGVLTFPAFDHMTDWYVFVFTATQFSGDLIESDEGILQWVDDDKLLDLPLWDGDQIFIPLLSQGQFFSGKFIYENGKLVEHVLNFY